MSDNLISVIIATYNRSKILYYSILSVIYQTYNNWELIVVGDCCTDDTEEVVKSFNNPKIKFVNLQSNFGEQSYPNNVGIKLAKGDYIAFLNHDDIWLPDHLETSCKTLIEKDADITFALICQIGNFGENSILNTTISGKYEPGMLIPASSWLLKKNVINQIGYWNSAFELRTSPSDDYMYRAYKNGLNIICTKKLTVVKISSLKSKKSYLTEDTLNQEIYNKIIENKNFREELLTEIVNGSFNDYSIKIHIFKLTRELIRKFSLFASKFLKINPSYIINFVAYGFRKGSLINYLREKRGLTKIKR